MRFLQGTLWAGALFDWCAAVLVLVPVRAIMDALGIPIGEPVMNFRFAGLLFAILPVFYVLGARRAELTAPIAAGATVVRVAGVVFLVAHLMRGQAAAAYAFFAVADAAFAIVHTIGLRRMGLGLGAAWRGSVSGTNARDVS